MKLTTLAILCSMIILSPLVAQSQVIENRLVKVLAFNVFGGRTTKLDFNIDAVAKVIQDADPDIVALQEVDYKVNRSSNIDLATELGWRTNMAPIFARAMYYDGGEYGVGILSRYSFLSSRNHPLPTIEGQEPRTALEVIVELPSKDTVALVSTHFSHEAQPGRVQQANEINRVFAGNTYPTILAGDLNSKPGSTPINILEKIWESTYNRENPEFTHPSDKPSAKIDYVMFYPKNRWRVVDKQVIADAYASDHCAYLVTLELLD